MSLAHGGGAIFTSGRLLKFLRNKNFIAFLNISELRLFHKPLLYDKVQRQSNKNDSLTSRATQCH